jgi:hypothetical protein
VLDRVLELHDGISRAAEAGAEAQQEAVWVGVEVDEVKRRVTRRGCRLWYERG